MSTSTNNNDNNNGVARFIMKRKKKRILIVGNQVARFETSNGNLSQTNASVDSLHSTGCSQYGSPKRSIRRKEIVLARSVNAESLRSLVKLRRYRYERRKALG